MGGGRREEKDQFLFSRKKVFAKKYTFSVRDHNYLQTINIRNPDRGSYAFIHTISYSAPDQ